MRVGCHFDRCLFGPCKAVTIALTFILSFSGADALKCYADSRLSDALSDAQNHCFEIQRRSSSKIHAITDIAEGVARTVSSVAITRDQLGNCFRFESDITEKSRSVGLVSKETGRRECILSPNGQHVIYMPGSLVVLGKETAGSTWGSSIISAPEAGGFLDGDVPTADEDGKSLLTLVTAGHPTLRPALERVSTRDCFAIDFSADNILGTLWISADRDHCIMKAHYVGTARGKIKKFEGLLDDVVSKNIGTDNFIWKAHFTWNLSYLDEDSPSDRIDVVAERDSLDLKPQFLASRFDLSDIVNGTQVQLDSARPSGVRYEWKNGNAIPVVNQATIKSIDDDIESFKNSKLTDQTDNRGTSPGDPSTANPNPLIGAAVESNRIYLIVACCSIGIVGVAFAVGLIAYRMKARST